MKMSDHNGDGMGLDDHLDRRAADFVCGPG